MLPFCAAQCRGRQPVLFGILRSPPKFNNVSSILKAPLEQAIWRLVSPGKKIKWPIILSNDIYTVYVDVNLNWQILPSYSLTLINQINVQAFNCYLAYKLLLFKIIFL